MLVDCQLWLTAFLIQVRSVTYHVNLFLQVIVIIPSVNWRPLTLPCIIWFNIVSFNLRFFATDCLLEISLLYHCHVSVESNANISLWNLLFLLFNISIFWTFMKFIFFIYNIWTDLINVISMVSSGDQKDLYQILTE